MKIAPVCKYLLYQSTSTPVWLLPDHDDYNQSIYPRNIFVNTLYPPSGGLIIHCFMGQLMFGNAYRIRHFPGYLNNASSRRALT
jgi:hypothetical protein